MIAPAAQLEPSRMKQAHPPIVDQMAYLQASLEGGVLQNAPHTRRAVAEQMKRLAAQLQTVAVEILNAAIELQNANHVTAVAKNGDSAAEALATARKAIEG